MKFWEIKNQIESDSTELLVYGEIADNSWWGEVGAKEFVADLARITTNNITARINSIGGNVFAGMAIYNSLKQHKATVTTYIDGLAASAASIIAMAGDKIVMPTGSMMMIHNAWTYTAGNADELREQADTLDKIDESIVAVYKAKTGLEDKQIKDMMSKDTWLTASEAKNLGFATDIEDLNISASLDGNNLIMNGVKFNYDKLPKNGLKISASAVIQNSNLKKEVSMTWEEVQAKFSNELKTLEDTAYANGVKAENQRLKDIDDLEISGHKNLVVAAKYGESTVNAGVLAMNVLKAQKEAGAKILNNIKADAEEITSVVDSKDEDGQEPKNDDEATLNKFSGLFASAAQKLKR